MKAAATIPYINDDSNMTQRTELLRDCAVMCNATADLLLRQSPLHCLTCAVCADICTRCATMCEGQAIPELAECAQACRLCAEACRIAAMVPTNQEQAVANAQ
jgi:hypothetical protein